MSRDVTGCHEMSRGFTGYREMLLMMSHLAGVCHGHLPGSHMGVTRRHRPTTTTVTKSHWMSQIGHITVMSPGTVCRKLSHTRERLLSSSTVYLQIVLRDATVMQVTLSNTGHISYEHRQMMVCRWSHSLSSLCPRFQYKQRLFILPPELRNIISNVISCTRMA